MSVASKPGLLARWVRRPAPPRPPSELVKAVIGGSIVDVELSVQAHPDDLHQQHPVSVSFDVSGRVCVFTDLPQRMAYMDQTKKAETHQLTPIEVAVFLYQPSAEIVAILVRAGSKITPQAWTRAIQNMEREADRRLATLNAIPFGDQAPPESHESLARYGEALEIVQMLLEKTPSLNVLVPPTQHFGATRFVSQTAEIVVSHLLRFTMPAIDHHMSTAKNRAILRRYATRQR